MKLLTNKDEYDEFLTENNNGKLIAIAAMIIAMVANMLSQSKVKVEVCGLTSRFFRLMRGIPQGAP